MCSTRGISDRRGHVEEGPVGANALLVDGDKSADSMPHSGEVGGCASMYVDVLTPIHFNIVEVLEIAI